MKNKALRNFILNEVSEAINHTSTQTSSSPIQPLINRALIQNSCKFNPNISDNMAVLSKGENYEY